MASWDAYARRCAPLPLGRTSRGLYSGGTRPQTDSRSSARFTPLQAARVVPGLRQLVEEHYAHPPHETPLQIAGRTGGLGFACQSAPWLATPSALCAQCRHMGLVDRLVCRREPPLRQDRRRACDANAHHPHAAMGGPERLAGEAEGSLHCDSSSGSPLSQRLAGRLSEEPRCKLLRLAKASKPSPRKPNVPRTDPMHARAS